MVVSRSAKVQKGLERKKKGRCQLHFREEDVQHILLLCSETRNWRLTVLKKNG
jgi:hypothetical protein